MSRTVTKTVGSGLTRHSKRHMVFDGPASTDDVERLSQALRTAAEQNVPWAWLEREKEIAERTLAAIEAGETGGDGDRIFEPWHGAGWFCRAILESAKRIESALAQGNVECVARISAELGELATTIRMKVAWDADLETGVKQRDYLARVRNLANESRHQDAAMRHAIWQESANEVWQDHPNWSNAAVAQLVLKKLGETAAVDTIRRRIRKLA